MLTTINTNHTRTQINEKQINMKLFRTKGEIKKKRNRFISLALALLLVQEEISLQIANYNIEHDGFYDQR